MDTVLPIGHINHFYVLQKSQSTNTRHCVDASHTLTTVLAPPLSNSILVRWFLSIIPSLVDGDSPQSDMLNTYVTRHNLLYFVLAELSTAVYVDMFTTEIYYCICFHLSQ